MCFGGTNVLNILIVEDEKLQTKALSEMLLMYNPKFNIYVAHNANKALETLVREARKIRKDKEEDVKKAQEVISLMNEIIDVCDAHRK